MNACRTCGKVEVNEMKTFLTDEFGEQTYQKIVEDVIGFKLKEPDDFPEKICNLCKSHMELITNMSVVWKENEKALPATIARATSVQNVNGISPTAPTSQDDSGFVSNTTQATTSGTKSPKTKRKRCKVIQKIAP